jgi:hypothetical protein
LYICTSEVLNKKRFPIIQFLTKNNGSEKMNSISQDASTPDSSQELEQLVATLSKMTSRSPEEIKPHLDRFLSELSQNPVIPKNHFFETATDEEWISAFFSWSESHKNKNLPVLSEEAMSRENMYPDRW